MPPFPLQEGFPSARRRANTTPSRLLQKGVKPMPPIPLQERAWPTLPTPLQKPKPSRPLQERPSSCPRPAPGGGEAHVPSPAPR